MGRMSRMLKVIGDGDDGELELVGLDTDIISFFDFLKTWNYPSDDHTRGYTTKGTYDIYWSRVQNVAHDASVKHGYEYSDTFIFSAMIEYYSDKMFGSMLGGDITCLEAIKEIGFYRRVVYNGKKEDKKLTEEEEDMTNMVFDRFRSGVSDSTTKRKKYMPHNCKVNSKIDRMYGIMGNIGMKMVDLTGLIIMMAAIENDRYLSTNTRKNYIMIMRSFFENVEKLHKTITGELNCEYNYKM